MATQTYQGYPCTQPYATDAPSIHAATASRWNNLPRRHIQPTNVVYVDLPDEGGSQVVWRNGTPSIVDKKPDPDEAPVIYIDVPDAGSSNEVAGPASEHATNVQWRNDSPNLRNKKPEDLEAPAVIYIELPEDSSGVGSTAAEDEPEFIQTIFYDPFENRRIDQLKEADNDSEASASPRPARPAPPRPTRLPLTNTTGYGSPGSSHGLPASLSNEAYGRQNDSDRFPISPIPVSQFPEPPPAYSEINTPHTPHTTHATSPASTVSATEPPRTRVITPGSELSRPPVSEHYPIGLPSPTRKVVNCKYCGLRVHTLVIWEAGPITHAVAITLALFMLFPLVILVYCTNFIKYQNHYCPNCNKKIGYELPWLCISMTYTKPETQQPIQFVIPGITR